MGDSRGLQWRRGCFLWLRGGRSSRSPSLPSHGSWPPWPLWSWWERADGDSGWWAVEGTCQMQTGSLGAFPQCLGAGGPRNSPGSTECGVLRGPWAGGWAGCEAGPRNGIAVGLPLGPRDVSRSKRSATGPSGCVAARHLCLAVGNRPGSRERLEPFCVLRQSCIEAGNGFVSGSGPRAVAAGGSRVWQYLLPGLHDGDPLLERNTVFCHVLTAITLPACPSNRRIYQPLCLV